MGIRNVVNQNEGPALHGNAFVLDDAFIKRVCDLIRIGMYPEPAMRALGVSKQTYYLWCDIANGKVKKKMRNGNEREYTAKERAPYQKLLDSLAQADVECDARDLAVIDKAANGAPTEYERYERDIRDAKTGELLHAKGELVLNGKGYPIVRRQGFTPDWHAAAFRIGKRRQRQWGNQDAQAEKNESTGPKIMITLPSNGREVKKDE